MEGELRIGLIGLDTSHVVAFTRLLNDTGNEYHVSGGRVVVGFPGGSEDFEPSRSRVEGFTNRLRDDYGVSIVESPEVVAEGCDAILLTSVDGRVHLEQFRRIARFGKPTFIDKPFAVTSTDAREMVELAGKSGIPLMSCSSDRYAEGFRQALDDTSGGSIIGADCYGPAPIEPTQPGLFWYGIHAVEMLFAALGKGCEHVSATTNEDHDLIVGVWKDGRVGTVRGNRKGNNSSGGLIHREKGTQCADVESHPKPGYASLLEHVMSMFRTGKPSIDPQETLELVRFIEAANESGESGNRVSL